MLWPLPKQTLSCLCWFPQGQVLLERGNIQSNRVEQFALNCCTSKLNFCIWITCSDKHIPGEHATVGKGCSPLEREWLGEKSNVLPAIATVAIFAIFKVFLSVEKYLSSTTSELREPCQNNVYAKSHACRQLLSKAPTCRQCGTTNQTLSPGFKPATSLPTSLTTPVMEVVTGYDQDDISNDHDYVDDDGDLFHLVQE